MAVVSPGLDRVRGVTAVVPMSQPCNLFVRWILPTLHSAQSLNVVGIILLQLNIKIFAVPSKISRVPLKTCHLLFMQKMQ